LRFVLTHGNVLCQAQNTNRPNLQRSRFFRYIESHDGVDVIFIRTGRWARAEQGPTPNYAGLHASCAKWLHDRGVAILGSDDAQDVSPSLVEGVRQPIHQLALVASRAGADHRLCQLSARARW
jgi:kynurenine formamidase